MKKMNVFTALLVLLLCIVGVGFYQGWFVLSNHRGDDGGNSPEVNRTADPDKANEDSKAVMGKAENLTDSSLERTPPRTTENPVKGDPVDPKVQ